jgi:hypothetical protein
MLVYGDVERIETVEAKQGFIQGILSDADRLPPGIRRHEALVSAFIGTSELVQSLVDVEFQERGFDARSPLHDTGVECLSVLAKAIAQSWQNGFAQVSLPSIFFTKLLSFDPSLKIRTKQAEGYAFYALYPEGYLDSAKDSGLGPDARVIGIRSIGMGLSALVAAALDAPPPLTLRPVGHPFGREVKVDPGLTEQLTANKNRAFAIVDEGPGLSGSSFGAVADWLERAGIPREQIHFFPSHAGGLGPQASDRHRERWSMAPRHLVTMDNLLLHRPGPHNLAAWVEDVIGPLEEPLEEVSGGAWRAKRYLDKACWPPANIQQERRKFLARAKGSSWLVKFAGLGETGSRKLQQGLQLHKAGFTPDIAGLRHGFLIERWHGDARSLDQVSFDRDDLIAQVGAYLAFRSRHFPAAEHQGASLRDLRHMAVYNTRQTVGEEAASALERSLGAATTLEGKVHRVCTDNRMHPWEWLVSGGRLIKTDALDHSAAHDLVGHQDITWDIAGAAIELELSQEEISRLCGIVSQESGHPVCPDLLAFMMPCYLAFQTGAHLMGAGALGEGCETMRLRRAADRYGSCLKRLESALGPAQEQNEAAAS